MLQHIANTEQSKRSYLEQYCLDAGKISSELTADLARASTDNDILRARISREREAADKLKEREAHLVAERKRLDKAVAAATQDAKASADRVVLAGLPTAEYLVDVTSSLLSRALAATYVSHFYLPLDGAEIKLERHIAGGEFASFFFFIVQGLTFSSPPGVLCLRAVEPNGSLRWTLEIGERDNLVRRVLLSNVEPRTAATDASVRKWVEASVATMTSKELSAQSGRSSSYVGFELPKRPVDQEAAAAALPTSGSPHAPGPAPSRTEKATFSSAVSRGEYILISLVEVTVLSNFVWVFLFSKHGLRLDLRLVLLRFFLCLLAYRT